MQYALSKDALNGKTLVVLELSGGNDGLNTIFLMQMIITINIDQILA